MSAPPITGYRQLTEQEIDAINEVKRIAEAVGAMTKRLSALGHHDERWLAIGTTQLQQGFMAINRAIARPTTF